MDFPGVHHAPFHSVIQDPRLTEVQLFSTRASKAALGIDIQQTRGGGQHRGGTLLPPVHLDSIATPSNSSYVPAAELSHRASLGSTGTDKFYTMEGKASIFINN